MTSLVEPAQSWMYREEHESDTGCYTITTYRLTNYGLLERNQIYVAGFRPASTAPFSCNHFQPMGSDGRIYDIEVAPDGDVWVATQHGAVKYNSLVNYTTEDRLADKAVRSITVEPDGSLWFAMLDGRAYHFDGTSWSHFTAEDGLISSYVHDVAIAPDGSVWFATREGASHWDRETDTWTHYTSENGLESNLVWTILFSSDGKVWFNQSGGTITSLAPASLPEKENVFDNYSMPFGRDPEAAAISDDGGIWFGRTLYDPKRQRWVDTVYWGDSRDLAEDNKGGLWIATDDGAVYIPDPLSSPERDWQYLGASQGLTDVDLTAVALETDTIVWFGAQAGGFRCNAKPGSE